MKRIIVFLFLFSFSQCFAQNYFPFNKNRPVYYNFINNSVTYYTQAGIYIDSFKVVGSDTVFYHYPIIDYDTTNGCYLKSHDPSFVARESIRSSNGFDEFFNKASDTIFLKNNSTLNDSWTFLNLLAGEKIIATVQSINSETILGLTDSVKIISLQATDSFGNTIPTIFNGKIYKIGKSFGLISGYSFLHIPNDTISFSIVGIENPSVGLSAEELTPQQVFDYNVGDRFDFSSGSIAFTGGQFDCTSKKIIGKEILGNGDSLIYTVKVRHSWFGSNMGNFSSGFNESIGTELILLSQKDFLLTRSFEWTDFLMQGEVSLISSIYESEKTEKNFVTGNFYSPFDTCLISLLSDGLAINRYAKGLGESYFYISTMTGYNFDTLSYYNKNGIEWGDSLHCFLTGIDELNFQSSVNLFPNPSSDKIFITGNFSPIKTQFILMNCLGEEINCNVNTDNGSVSIDISSLPSDFYFLVVNNGNEFAHLKFIKN